MSDNEDIEQEGQYITTKKNGEVVIEPDAYINEDTIENVSFAFAEGQDITESVQKKNQKNKTPVSYTRNGRTAYAPITVTYPDGSTSSKFLLENCVVQYTEAIKAQNHSYARDFVIIGIPSIYIDTIMDHARKNSKLNLGLKPNTSDLNGHYWLRCNLDKLGHKNTQIMTENGPINMSVDSLLKEFKKNLVCSIVFSLSGSMINNNMSENLDLADGTYTIAMKPTEVYAQDVSNVLGPTLEDTNSRKKEGAAASETFLAKGALADFAARKLKISGK